MEKKSIIGKLAITSAFLLMSNTGWAQNNIAQATNRAKLQDLSYHLKQRAEADQKHARDQAKLKGWPTRQEFPDGTLIELQRLSPTGMPVYYETHNIDAADTVSTDEVWSSGSAGLSLDGTGMTVGEWDGGAVLGSHQELSGRVTQVDGVSTTHYHATHVAGTMIAEGVDADAKGMSYAANLEAYDWNLDATEMAAAAGAVDPLLLSNHSYGSITGWTTSYSDPNCSETHFWFGVIGDTEDYNFGYYDYWASVWDTIAIDAPYYLIVKSAGNDRDDVGPGSSNPYCVYNGSNWVSSTAARDDDCGPDGYDCISTTGTAKNILTVGAAGDIPGGYPGARGNNVPMTSFSGWGPTDDGRIKPDIVANGYQLRSSMDTNNTSYDLLSGTSMAAPNATGSLLLLQEHYQETHGTASMRSATLKALAIHTADEAGDNAGPDYENGWGLLNTRKAAEVISGDGSNNHRIIESSLANAGTYEIQINSGGVGTEIKATLVWTDPPGTPAAPSVDPADIMLINDLDLRISGNGITYTPWMLDPANPANPAGTGDNIRDNVEQVVIPLTTDGIYTLTVNHKNTLDNGDPQAFSLIISTEVSNKHELIANADFEGGLPAGWSVSDLGAHGLNWRFDNPSNYANFTGGSGLFAVADAQVGGGCYLMNSELRMTSLDLSNYSDVILVFKTFSNIGNYPSEYTNVEVSIDGGGAWTTVWDRDGGTGTVDYSVIGVDLSSLVDEEADVLIRFHFDNTSRCYIWEVDDVAIYGVPTTPDPACGNGIDLPTDQWSMISLPCDPGASNKVNDIFSDDFTGTYDDTWVLFEWNELGGQYAPLAPDAPLVQGEGYWIYALENATLDVNGTETPLTTSAECPGGCFEISLDSPATPETSLYNMKGHSLPYSVNWADVLIRVTGDVSSPFTPSGAFAANHLDKIFNTYNGNGYDPYDDITPGMQGVLGSLDGFWVEALNNSLLPGALTLLIPPKKSSGIIMASQEIGVAGKEDVLIASDTTVPALYNTTRASVDLGSWFDWLVPVAHAASESQGKTASGLAKRDAHRAQHVKSIKDKEEWFIRLTVEAPDEGMKDRGNVLGQLADSEYGYDIHDLKEMPPFGSSYLTLVFPHHDWEDRADNYASDFHPLSRRNGRDSWVFEVHTDDPDREISLSWSGLDEILKNSYLVDNETGEVIQVIDAPNYTFVMGSTSRSFTWHHSEKRKIYWKKRQ